MEIEWNMMGKWNGKGNGNKYLMACGIKKKYVSNVIGEKEWSGIYSEVNIKENGRKLKE